MTLDEWFHTKAGVALLRDVHRIADALERLARYADTLAGDQVTPCPSSTNCAKNSNDNATLTPSDPR
jgi:hypothetical protein